MPAGVARIEKVEAAMEPLFSQELPPGQSAEWGAQTPRLLFDAPARRTTRRQTFALIYLCMPRKASDEGVVGSTRGACAPLFNF